MRGMPHRAPAPGWFVRSKLSGVRQVFAVNLDTYSRPIPSPVRHLRPARETCEQCHWPIASSATASASSRPTPTTSRTRRPRPCSCSRSAGGTARARRASTAATSASTCASPTRRPIASARSFPA
jgi:hypothetical protein